MSKRKRRVLFFWENDNLCNLAYYVGHWAVFDHAVAYDEAIGVFAGTFSLNSYCNRTSTLLTDSFCREQSMITRVKPLKKEFNWNDGLFLSRGI